MKAAIGRARTLTISVVGSAIFFATLGVTTNVGAIATTAFISALTTMLWNVITVSFRQRVTPDHLLGRLNSTYRLVAWGTRPLGAAIGGALGQWLGVRSVFAVMAGLATAALIPNRRITDAALAAAETEYQRSSAAGRGAGTGSEPNF